MDHFELHYQTNRPVFFLSKLYTYYFFLYLSFKIKLYQREPPEKLNLIHYYVNKYLLIN